jgi:hypothetical protein
MSNPNPFFEASLATRDTAVRGAILKELERQQSQVELIASENIVSRAVLEAQGSVLTNKYAEGYPGKRYYGGCEYADVIETLALDRIKQLFNAKFANVQPHSGAQANGAVMLALVKPGDTVLGMSLDAGGHLTHDADRLRADRGTRAATQARAADRRLLGLSARAGLRTAARDRRRRRRQADGGYGAYRRGDRGGTSPESGGTRARGHVDHPQDTAWPARRLCADE